MNAVDEGGVPHPMIVSESGRATVADHAVLVFNILHATRFDPPSLPDQLPEDASETLLNLKEVKDALTLRNFQEAYHDALGISKHTAL